MQLAQARLAQCAPPTVAALLLLPLVVLPGSGRGKARLGREEISVIIIIG
jgi:hypothetical protein